jgi:hypothetical protein
MIVRSDMLSVGTIAKLSVDAYDTKQANMTSRYLIMVQPVHYLPSTHKIEVLFPTIGNFITLNPGPCSITQVSGPIVLGEA